MRIQGATTTEISKCQTFAKLHSKQTITLIVSMHTLAFKALVFQEIDRRNSEDN